MKLSKNGFSILPLVFFLMMLGAGGSILLHFSVERRRAIQEFGKSEKKLQLLHRLDNYSAHSRKIKDADLSVNFDRGTKDGDESKIKKPVKHRIKIIFSN